MRPQIVSILVFAVMFFQNTLLFSQGVSDSKTPPTPQTNKTPIELPIDNGILILVIVGILYGVFVLNNKRKLKNNAH